MATNVYRISPRFFANSTDNPDNWCFFAEGDGSPREGKEIPSGLFNASACLFGSPTFMSQPHFYQADPVYLDGVAPGCLPIPPWY